MENFLRKREDFIERWSANTISLFESEIKSNNSIDHLCITSLTVSGRYCEAITTLLEKDFRMPAKALLRVLFELSVKIIWCLIVPDDKKDDADKVIGEKIKRWAKSTVKQNIKILNEFKECVTPESNLEERLREFEELEKSLVCKELPGFKNLFSDLPDSWVKEIYPQCYLQFNNAIHLDITSLGERVKESGNKFSVESDSTETIEDLAQYCILFEFNILYLVRNYYDWDTKEMQKEFPGINKKIKKTKE